LVLEESISLKKNMQQKGRPFLVGDLTLVVVDAADIIASAVVVLRVEESVSIVTVTVLLVETVV
jgi:hypothetical protein